MSVVAVQSITFGNISVSYGPVPAGTCWRMMWTDEQQQNKTQVENLFESDSTTYTQLHLFLATTREECVDHATELGMQIPSDQELAAKSGVVAIPG